MSQQLTIADVVEGYRALQQFSADTGKDLPLKLSYRFGRIVGAFREEAVQFDEARAERAKALTVNGKTDIPALQEEITQLLKEQAELEFFPVKFSKLNDKLKVSPDVLETLFRVGVLLDDAEEKSDE